MYFPKNASTKTQYYINVPVRKWVKSFFFKKNGEIVVCACLHPARCVGGAASKLGYLATGSEQAGFVNTIGAEFANLSNRITKVYILTTVSISQHILELYFYLGFVGKLLCFFCSPARKPQQSPPPFLHPSGSHLLIILSCLFAYNNTASYLEEKEEKDRPRLPPSQTLSHCDQAPGLKNAEKQ